MRSKPPVCVFVSRLQDAVSLVSLFHMVHPHSESTQEAASQQATGTDLLKVRTHKLDRKYPLTRSYFTLILTVLFYILFIAI